MRRILSARTTRRNRQSADGTRLFRAADVGYASTPTIWRTRCMMRRRLTTAAAIGFGAMLIVAAIVTAMLAPMAKAQSPRPMSVDVTVHEGTSMAIALSPDKRTLVLDLQGGLWTLPAAGGAAKRITDEYGDARQPSWSPDGTRI